MTDKLLSLFKQKKTIWLICSIPLLWILFQAFFLSPLEYKFWSTSLAISGFSAAVLLFLTLSFAPLSKHFPSQQIFFILNRHKRQTGLSCFYYAVIHVISLFIKVTLKRGGFDWKFLLHPMLLAGETALLIFLALALTSNDISIKILGYLKWKFLHRWIYLAEAAVFTHMALQGGIVLFWAIALFIPLLAIQLLRRRKIT